MAHVPLQTTPRASSPGWPARYSKRRFGQMVEPTAAASHHSGVLVAMGSLETAVADGLEEARSDAALAGHPGRRRPDRLLVVRRLRLLRGHAPGRRPGQGPGRRTAGGRATSSTSASGSSSSTPRRPPAAPAEVSDELAARLRAPLQRRRDRRAGRPGWRWRTSAPASTPASACAARGSPTSARSRCRSAPTDATLGRRCLTLEADVGRLRGVALAALRHRLPDAGQRQPTPRTSSRRPASDGCGGATSRSSRCGPTWSRS